MKENAQLDKFYIKLQSLATNIRALGEKMKESNVVKKLLRLVPSKFMQIASTIKQFENLKEMFVGKLLVR